MDDDHEIWPDPGGWVARLNAKLVELDAQYYGHNMIRRMELDPDDFDNPDIIDSDAQANATLTTAGALAAVIKSLKEIPTFQGNVGLQALSDLAMALLDLDKGLRPALLQPRPGESGTSDYGGRRLLKSRAILCVELLELAGWTATASQKAVANIFSDAGFSGRKKSGSSNPGLSWKTIHDWSGALAAHGADREGRMVIDSAIADWKRLRTWPPVAKDVLEFATTLAIDPSLRTTI